MARPRPRRARAIGPYTHVYREPEGWSVRLCRRGKVFSDYFGYAVYGGRVPALVAAQHFRDRTLQRVEPDTRVRRAVPRGVRTRTGIVGVTLEWHVVEGRRYQRFVAGWVDAEKKYARRR